MALPCARAPGRLDADGLRKNGYPADEASPAALETMKAIKRTLDPRNIMNPGKVVAV